MSKDNLSLIVAEYKNAARAQTILDMIHEMKDAHTINIADAAMVTKTPEGKLNIEETQELTTRKGARRGAIILGTIGLIFPPSFIASVLVGGGVGALSGKLRDSGIKTDEMERFANEMDPDHAAVMVLAHSDSVSRVTGALQGYEGKLITQEIDAGAAAEVAKAAGAADAGAAVDVPDTPAEASEAPTENAG